MIVLILVCLPLLTPAWWPFVPSLSLQDKHLKGPVKTVIENVDYFSGRNIVVQHFNREGLLTEIRFFDAGSKVLHDPEVGAYVVDKPSHYMGLDTTRMVLARVLMFSYDSASQLINEKHINNEQLVYWENTYIHFAKDSSIRINYSRDEWGVHSDTAYVSRPAHVPATSAKSKNSIRIDAKGNVTKYYDEKKKLICLVRYRYDKHDNWVLKELYENNLLAATLSRSITYYNEK